MTKRSFARSTGLMVGLRVLSAAFNYGTIALAALVLSGRDYGHFGTIMAFLTFAGVIARFGSEISVVRFLGQYRSKKEPKLAAGAVTWSQRVALAASIVIGLISIPFWINLPQYSTAAVAYILAAVFILPFFAIADTESAIIRSYNGIFMAIAPKDVLWRLGMIFVLLAIWQLDIRSEVRLNALIVSSAVLLAALVIAQIVSQTRLRYRKDGVVARSDIETDWSAWRKTSLTVWVLLVARVSLRSVDVLIIGLALGVETSGVYFLVSRTAELMGFLLTSLNLVLGPLVAKGHADGKTDMIRRRLAQIASLLFFATVPILLVIIFAGRELLSYFGEDFVTGYGALVILALGQFVNAAFGGCGVVLNMTGHERANARALLWTTPVSLALLVVFTPIYGMVGAAAAIALGLTVWNVWIWAEVRRLTPYDPSIFGAAGYYFTRKSSGQSHDV